jgi:hypothetical protein
MTLYLNFRSQSVGGAAIDPMVLEGDGTASVPALKIVDPTTLGSRLANKNVLFGVHGFNVSREEGERSLGRLEPLLNLTSSDVFIGVLWPGDSWIPVVNYPFEGDVAMDCGRRLAMFCAQYLSRTSGFSFVSHSLGARLVLEAVKNLNRKAGSVCLTAGAINRDCLTREYAAAFSNAGVISVLASQQDMVLRLAFPIGDPIADILNSDHAFFTPALGYKGPAQPIGATVPPWQIPDAQDYGHGDYLPPSAPTVSAAQNQNPKWQKPAGFMSRAFRRQQQTWP